MGQIATANAGHCNKRAEQTATANRPGSAAAVPAVPFDLPHYQAINSSRLAALREIIGVLRTGSETLTAADYGCGAGYFSGHLHDMGFRVFGVDLRPENLELARTRYPRIRFYQASVEDSGCRDLEATDLVLCLGLLYHLENPFAAIRNLHQQAKRWMVIESQVAPGDGASLAMRREMEGADQSQHYLALIPTRTALVGMLYAAGFQAVWMPLRMPDHPHFQGGEFAATRTLLVATKAADCDGLSAIARRLEPPLVPTDLWR